MSVAEMRNLENELELLSYAEQLSLMAYLVRLMQKRQAESEQGEIPDGEPNEETLEAAAEIREQVAAGNAGTTDVDAFFAELDG